MALLSSLHFNGEGDVSPVSHTEGQQHQKQFVALGGKVTVLWDVLCAPQRRVLSCVTALLLFHGVGLWLCLKPCGLVRRA